MEGEPDDDNVGDVMAASELQGTRLLGSTGGWSVEAGRELGNKRPALVVVVPVECLGERAVGLGDCHGRILRARQPGSGSQSRVGRTDARSLPALVPRTSSDATQCPALRTMTTSLSRVTKRGRFTKATPDKLSVHVFPCSNCRCSRFHLNW